MALYNPTEADYAIINQSVRNINVRVELLDEHYSVIDRIDGVLISDNYTVDRSSDVRRTASLVFHVADDRFLVSEEKYVWFGKYMRLFYGLYSYVTHDYIWYRMGVYLWDQASYQYDATMNNLTLNCLDLMAGFTESYGGQLPGQSTKILAGSNIRNAMISTITQLGNVTDYRIDPMEGEVPYDLEYGCGTYPYQIITDLRDLYVGWETFFDDTQFVCQQYSIYNNDPIVLSADVFDPLVISETTTTNFASIKNVTEIWGANVKASFTATEVVYADSNYQLTIDAKDSTLVLGDVIVFTADANCADSVSVSINSGSPIRVYNASMQPLKADDIMANVSYAIKYLGDDIGFEFIGKSSDLYQVSAINKLVSKAPTEITVVFNSIEMSMYERDLIDEPSKNITYTIDPASPFAVDKIGERRRVLSDGEYAMVYSNDLASQRAVYETWQTTALLDTVSLTMVDIPWLDVNQKVQYRSLRTGETKTYRVNRKSGTIAGGTMTLELSVFQPTYSWNRTN